MALPLFQFKADPVDLSGVELNLGTAGSVISTSLNSDYLYLTSSALNFSNASQTFTVSKDGLDTVSNDLKKTISLRNTSAIFALTDFTANTSYPNKTMLTPLGMSIYDSGESGEVVHMNASSIIVGGTSVSWTNIIASGAELQNIEALTAPPNVNTIAIVHSLLLESNVPASLENPSYKIECSAIGPTYITQSNIGDSLTSDQLIETTLSNSQLDLKKTIVSSNDYYLMSLTPSLINISQVTVLEGNSYESTHAMNYINFINGTTLDSYYGIDYFSVNDRTDPLLIKESNYTPDQLYITHTGETTTKGITLSPDAVQISFSPSIYGTSGTVLTEMNTGQFSIIDNGVNGLSKILNGDIGLVQESIADDPSLGSKTSLTETSLTILDKVTTGSSIVSSTGVSLTNVSGGLDLTTNSMVCSNVSGYTISSVEDLSITGTNVALNVSAGNVKFNGANLISASSQGTNGLYLTIVINDIPYKLILCSL